MMRRRRNRNGRSFPVDDDSCSVVRITPQAPQAPQTGARRRAWMDRLLQMEED